MVFERLQTGNADELEGLKVILQIEAPKDIYKTGEMNANFTLTEKLIAFNLESEVKAASIALKQLRGTLKDERISFIIKTPHRFVLDLENTTQKLTVKKKNIHFKGKSFFFFLKKKIFFTFLSISLTDFLKVAILQ